MNFPSVAGILIGFFHCIVDAWINLYQIIVLNADSQRPLVTKVIIIVRSKNVCSDCSRPWCIVFTLNCSEKWLWRPLKSKLNLGVCCKSQNVMISVGRKSMWYGGGGG